MAYAFELMSLSFGSRRRAVLSAGFAIAAMLALPLAAAGQEAAPDEMQRAKAALSSALRDRRAAGQARPAPAPVTPAPTTAGASAEPAAAAPVPVPASAPARTAVAKAPATPERVEASTATHVAAQKPVARRPAKVAASERHERTRSRRIA